MNPRQRRGTLLLALAIIGAVAVFLSVSSYVAEVRREVGPKQLVLQLNTEAIAFQPLPAESVEQVEVPEKYVPQGAITDDELLEGSLVPAADLPAGTILQEGILGPLPALKEGEQELAIAVDAVTGVIGQIFPGAKVDIYASFPGGGDEGDVSSEDCSMLLMSDVTILDVGGERPDPDATETGAPDVSTVIPVTFALPPELGVQLVYAESFAQEVRLAVRGATADTDVDTGPVGSTGARVPSPGDCSLPPGLTFEGGGG
ncbi:MAG: Flp pilus assembly protein CpaB [Actinomycetota bacterium]